MNDKSSRKERFTEILSIVNSKGEILVEDLANTFTCSVETIRRDLRYLESQGKVTRCFGKAVSVLSDDIGRKFEKRKDEHILAKELMAEKASRLISPGLTIALDSSSTCFYLARMLPDFSLKIVTNSIRLLTSLNSNSKHEVIGTGGVIDEKHGDFILQTTSRQLFLPEIKIDLMFMSCAGIDLNTGLYDMNKGIALMKNALMRRSARVVLLADSFKYDKKTPFPICSLSNIDYVIDDGTLNNSKRQTLHDLDINII